MFQKSYNQLDQPVIAKPTVTIVPKSDCDQTLVLGSDGIFDVFQQSELLSDFVVNRFKVYGKSQRISQDIIDTCFARGSTDNMTILLVNPNPSCTFFEEKEAKKEEELDNLIKQKVKKVLSAGSYQNLTPQTTQSLMYKVFTEIHNDPTVKDLLPPGAYLSAKSTLIKEQFHEIVSSPPSSN